MKIAAAVSNSSLQCVFLQIRTKLWISWDWLNQMETQHQPLIINHIITFINRLHCWITKGELLHVVHFTPGAVTRKLLDDHCCCHMLGLTTKHWGQGWRRLTQWPPPAENIYVTDWQSSVDWGQVRLYHDHTHSHHLRHRAVSRPETWGPVIIIRLFWESWFYVLSLCQPFITIKSLNFILFTVMQYNAAN